MAEKHTEQEEVQVATVAKAEYERVISEYSRLSAAFDKAINIIATSYAERVVKDIFDSVDKAVKK